MGEWVKSFGINLNIKPFQIYDTVPLIRPPMELVKCGVYIEWDPFKVHRKMHFGIETSGLNIARVVLNFSGLNIYSRILL